MFSITQNGKPLDPSKYTWDEKTKTLSTNEKNLILDFSGYDGVTFKTGSYCVFTTGWFCVFKTGENCVFKTGGVCTFKTGEKCTFDTGENCTFTTWYSCTFTTGENCVIVRRDIFEVIQPEKEKTIKLNDWGVKGYTYVNNKQKVTLELTEEQLEKIKDIIK